MANGLNLWIFECIIKADKLSDFHKRFRGKKTCEDFAAGSCTDEMASKEGFENC